jgi:hypothetical protein
MSPVVPEGQEAVQEHNERAVAETCRAHVQADRPTVTSATPPVRPIPLSSHPSWMCLNPLTSQNALWTVALSSAICEQEGEARPPSRDSTQRLHRTARRLQNVEEEWGFFPQALASVEPILSRLS